MLSSIFFDFLVLMLLVWLTNHDVFTENMYACFTGGSVILLNLLPLAMIKTLQLQWDVASFHCK